MISETLRAKLSSTIGSVYLNAVRELVATSKAEVDWPTLLREVLDTIADSPVNGVEQRRRVTLLLRTIPFRFNNSVDLVRRFVDVPTFIKSGLSSAIPQHLRPVLYGGQSGTSISTTSLTEPVQSALLGMTIESLRADEGHPGVVLLSSQVNQDTEENLRLLEKAQFPVMRASNEQELDRALGESPTCGIVVNGSFWLGLDQVQQARALTSIASYSSIITLFIDTTNYWNVEQIHEIIKRSRQQLPKYDQVLVRGDGRLVQSDIRLLKSSAELISEDERPLFGPANLDDTEVIALVATAKLFFKEECRRDKEPLERIRLTVVPGGRSQAKLVLLYLNEYERPFVGKVGPFYYISNEASRFNKYIRMTDEQLNPYVHVHGKAGAIIFGLIEDSTNPFAPAPTLEAKLQRLWTMEIWPSEKQNPDTSIQVDWDREATNLRIVFARVFAKLSALNKQPCTETGFESWAYLDASGLLSLVEDGVQWSFGDIKGKDILKAVSGARAVRDIAGNVAVVHGDMHLRNVLIRDEQMPYIIDYNYAGPGHPAHDFVLFECALTFRYLRLLGSEAQFAELQQSLSLDLCTEEELRKRFPDWFSSLLNSIILSAIVACRDNCIALLKYHDLGTEHYRAAKLLMACHSLTLADLQMGLAKATVTALAPAFMA